VGGGPRGVRRPRVPGLPPPRAAVLPALPPPGPRLLLRRSTAAAARRSAPGPASPSPPGRGPPGRGGGGTSAHGGPVPLERSGVRLAEGSGPVDPSLAGPSVSPRSPESGPPGTSAPGAPHPPTVDRPTEEDPGDTGEEVREGSAVRGSRGYHHREPPSSPHSLPRVPASSSDGRPPPPHGGAPRVPRARRLPGGDLPGEGAVGPPLTGDRSPWSGPASASRRGRVPWTRPTLAPASDWRPTPPLRPKEVTPLPKMAVALPFLVTPLPN